MYVNLFKVCQSVKAISCFPSKIIRWMIVVYKPLVFMWLSKGKILKNIRQKKIKHKKNIDDVTICSLSQKDQNLMEKGTQWR